MRPQILFHLWVGLWLLATSQFTEGLQSRERRDETSKVRQDPGVQQDHSVPLKALEGHLGDARGPRHLGESVLRVKPMLPSRREAATQLHPGEGNCPRPWGSPTSFCRICVLLGPVPSLLTLYLSLSLGNPCRAEPT